jgi:transcription initiation factor TFIIIB Brf1 subunit/transcription initiation factor TFIIB
LVAQEGDLVPDGSWYEHSADYCKAYYDNYEDEYPAPEPKDRFIKNMTTICQQVLDLKEATIAGAVELFTTYRSQHLRRGDNMTGIMAACVYYACKSKTPLPILVIANAFKVSTGRMNKCCVDIKDSIKIKTRETGDMLVRMVYELDDIDDKWTVVKTCRKLIDKLAQHPLYQSQRQSKIYATIIFIACKINKLGVSKGVIQKALNVTALTMINHEKMIQNLLAKS